MYACKYENGDAMSKVKKAKSIFSMVGEDLNADFKQYSKLILGVLFISGIEILCAFFISIFSKFDLVLVLPLVLILSNFTLLSQLRKVKDELEDCRKESFGYEDEEKD